MRENRTHGSKWQGLETDEATVVDLGAIGKPAWNRSATHLRLAPRQPLTLHCLSEFESYVGIAYEDSRLDVSYIFPVRDGWESEGDREFICFLYDLNLEKLSGSMQGSGE